MKYDLSRINEALVETMANLLCGDAQYSAKSLENTIASFFFDAGGLFANTDDRRWADAKKDEEMPEGYVYPWRADLPSLIKMCEAIYQASRGKAIHRRHWDLIRKIRELSEQYMAEFRNARDAGTYRRNVGYIRELDDSNDWGRWMLALRQVFSTPEELDQMAPA